MLYARYADPQIRDIVKFDFIKRQLMRVGERYEVSHIDIDHWSNYDFVHLKDFENVWFDLKGFIIENEIENPINIYSDPEINPYLTTLKEYYNSRLAEKERNYCHRAGLEYEPRQSN